MSAEKEILTEELESVFRLFRSPDWKQFVSFLEVRKGRLQEKANQKFLAGNNEEGREYLAIMKDHGKMIDLFKREVLEKQQKLKTKESR